MFSFAVMLEFVFLKTSPDNNRLTFINAGGGFVGFCVKTIQRKNYKSRNPRHGFPPVALILRGLSLQKDYKIKIMNSYQDYEKYAYKK